MTAPTRPAQGISANTIAPSHRKPLALAICERDERPGSRYLPLAVTSAPRRRSKASSIPTTTGPVATTVSTTKLHTTCATARLDPRARFNPRCYV